MNMAPPSLTMSPNYRAYVRGIRELHQLSIEGKEDSPEADAIRDATDVPWEALSEDERVRAANLSEDLFSLVEPSPSLQPMTDHDQAKLAEDLTEVLEAIERSECDRALNLVRQVAPFLAPDVASYLRGRVWLDAGDIETAALFFEHASRVQPDNGNYLALFLYALEKVDPIAAQKRAHQILQRAGQDYFVCRPNR